jgi:hypothetical protein
MNNKAQNFTKIVILTILFLLIYGCKPRVKSHAPENPVKVDPAWFDSHIVFSGRIITREKTPIVAAEIQVRKESVLTDRNGYFKIIVEKDTISLLAKYVLNIRKKGYGFISDITFNGITNKVYIMKEATVMNIDPTMVNTVVDSISSANPLCCGTLRSLIDWGSYPELRFPENVSENVRSAMEASETRNSCNPGVTVVIPANALVDDNGDEPRNILTVSLSTIDIFDENSLPGDNSVMANGKLNYLETYGAMNIDVYSGDTTYQLKKGEYAEIIVPVNPDQLEGENKLDETMPLLLYDEEKGVWKVEGQAKLNKKGDAYIAKITHFSSYNMDLYKEDPACIKLDASNTVGAFYVEVDYVSTTGDIVTSRKKLIESNSDDNIHALYNLPPNTNVGITIGRKYGETYTPLYTIEANTGDPIPEDERPCPELPYTSCGDAITVFGNPVLSTINWAQVVSPVYLFWRYVFPPSTSNRTYTIQEEMITDCTEPTGSFADTPEGTGIDQAEYYIGLPRNPGCYHYRIRGEWDDGASEWSNTLSVQVIEPSDKQLTIVNNIESDSYNAVLQFRVGNEVLNDPSTEILEADNYCELEPGREITSGQSLTIPIDNSQYEVYIGLGIWQWNADDCTDQYKKNMVRDYSSGGGYGSIYYHWHLTVYGHFGGEATFTLKTNDTDNDNYCHIEFENGATYDIRISGSSSNPIIH